jgi:hypothetical protein
VSRTKFLFPVIVFQFPIQASCGKFFQELKNYSSANYPSDLPRFITDFSPCEDRKPLVSYQALPKPERVSEADFCARGGFFCNFLQIFLEFNLG